MVVVKPIQNVTPEGEQGSFVGGVSAVPSSAIGSMYTRGARCSYEGRVLLTRGSKRGNESMNQPVACSSSFVTECILSGSEILINPMLKNQGKGTYECYEAMTIEWSQCSDLCMGSLLAGHACIESKCLALGY